jgi:hypothetical protein
MKMYCEQRIGTNLKSVQHIYCIFLIVFPNLCKTQILNLWQSFVHNTFLSSNCKFVQELCHICIHTSRSNHFGLPLIRAQIQLCLLCHTAPLPIGLWKYKTAIQHCSNALISQCISKFALSCSGLVQACTSPKNLTSGKLKSQVPFPEQLLLSLPSY